MRDRGMSTAVGAILGVAGLALLAVQAIRVIAFGNVLGTIGGILLWVGLGGMVLGALVTLASVWRAPTADERPVQPPSVAPTLDMPHSFPAPPRPQSSQIPTVRPTTTGTPLLTPEQLLAGQAGVDPRILQQLRGGQDLEDTKCLHCGYEGPMPVIARRWPWWATWWVIIPLCFTGIGGLTMLLLIASGAVNQRITRRCPNCQRILGPVTHTAKRRLQPSAPVQRRPPSKSTRAVRRAGTEFLPGRIVLIVLITTVLGVALLAYAVLSVH
jgi:hypothetical protein